MARIQGVDLPKNKRIEAGLTYIFGIGFPSSRKILGKLGISPDTRVKDLSYEETIILREEIENNYVVEGDKRREVALNIKAAKENGSYRGLRHKKKLPVRGQRTRTNARNARGGGARIAVSKKRKK